MSFFNAGDKNGTTPLMHAARQGWDDLVRLLVDGGAQATPVDANGRSAADYADNAGYGALARTLREDPK
jgi:ankyrin repeat protein